MITSYMQERLARKNGSAPALPTKKEQKPIPKKSSKRKEDDKEYKKLRTAFLKKHPVCEANLPDCSKQATEVHHAAGRHQNLLNVKTWKALCNSCHRFVTDHPREAIKLKLSSSRLEIHEEIGGKKVKLIDKV